MEDAVEKLKALAQYSKSLQKTELPEKPVSAKVIQLPLWPNATRGLPNSLGRCALFTVRYRRSKRMQYKSRQIATLGDAEILYTGEELRQDDETVFLQLLHLARMLPLSEPVEFTPYSFLKEIKWPTSGRNHYDRLATTIKRLKANMLELSGLQIKETHVHYGGSLVRKFVYEENNERLRKWTVWLEPEIINLFQAVTYSRIEWEQRLGLKKPMSLWLHSFYTSHQAPFPMRVEKIRELCGSSTDKLDSFRGTLKIALTELVTMEFLQKWWIDPNDLVHVIRA